MATPSPLDITSCDEAQLLQHAHAGNEEALGLLLFRLQPMLLSTIRPQLGNQLRARVTEEDILQEAYRRAFVSFSSGDFAQAQTDAAMPGFVAWLKRIATNCILELGRMTNAKKRGGDFSRQAQGLLTEISTGDATVSQFVARNEASEALMVALASLPADQQQAVRLRYFENLGIELVAQRMERSAGSIRGLLDRARAALRIAMHNSALWFSKHG